MKAVRRREILVYQLQKLFGNISGDITAKWWIKPYDVPIAASPYCSSTIKLGRKKTQKAAST